MSTKQIRLGGAHQLVNRLQEFEGKQITIVLNDGNVLLGVLNSSSENWINLTNMRLKKTRVAVSKINEIYFDVRT